jgi:hypothetical protein
VHLILIAALKLYRGYATRRWKSGATRCQYKKAGMMPAFLATEKS